MLHCIFTHQQPTTSKLELTLHKWTLTHEFSDAIMNVIDLWWSYIISTHTPANNLRNHHHYYTPNVVTSYSVLKQRRINVCSPAGGMEKNLSGIFLGLWSNQKPVFQLGHAASFGIDQSACSSADHVIGQWQPCKQQSRRGNWQNSRWNWQNSEGKGR